MYCRSKGNDTDEFDDYKRSNISEEIPSRATQ